MGRGRDTARIELLAGSVRVKAGGCSAAASRQALAARDNIGSARSRSIDRDDGDRGRSASEIYIARQSSWS
eukprot:6209052-Pleurochrysis_carterae.AAC.5